MALALTTPRIMASDDLLVVDALTVDSTGEVHNRQGEWGGRGTNLIAPYSILPSHL